MVRPRRAILPIVVVVVAVAVAGGVLLLRSDPALEREILRDAELRQLHEQAHEAWSAGNTDAVRAHIREMSARDPEHPLVYDAYIWMRVTPGSPAAAREFLESLGSQGAGRKFLSGYLLLHEGGTAPAEQARGYEQAAAAFREAFAAYAAAGHRTGQAFCRYRIGFVLHRLAERIPDDPRVESILEEAERELLLAREEFERLRDDSKVGDVLNNLGRIAVRRGRLEEALRLQHRAVAVLAGVGDAYGESIVQMGIARVQRKLFAYELEQAAWERAVALSRQIANRVNLAESLGGLAAARLSLEDCDGATETATEAVRVAESLGKGPRAALARLDLATMLVNCEQPAAALEALEPALAQFRPADRVGPARLTHLRGAARMGLGEWTAAQELLEETLHIARDLGQTDLEVAALSDLGHCFWATGRLDAALAAREQALMLGRGLGDKRREVARLSNLGSVHWMLGRLDVAGRILEEAVDKARAFGPRDLARPLENLALVRSEQGHIEEGLAHAREALQIRNAGRERGRVAVTHWIAGRLLLLSGLREEAFTEAEMALEISREGNDLDGEAAALNLQGEVLVAQGRFEDALETYDRVLTLAGAVSTPHEPTWARSERARVFTKQGRLRDALVEYELALGLLESQRARLGPADLRMRFVARNARIYEAAVELGASIAAGGDGATAFALAERARARGFADSMAESVSGYRKLLDPALAERERLRRDALATAATRLDRASSEDERAHARLEIDRAEDALLQLRFELQQASPAYADLSYPEPARLEEVQRNLLRPGEAMLAYFFAREHVWLWLIRRGEAQIRELAPAAEIDELVRRFRARVGHAGGTLGGAAAGRDAAEALGRALLGDVVLQPGERLLVVPHGSMHHLPFEALRRDGRYLVEDHEVLLIPSATTLRVIRERTVPTATGGFLGLGDPVAAVAPLPDTVSELAGIAELFPSGERLILAGPEFTKAAITETALEGFRFVHFATHGRIDPEDATRLALVLSDTAAGEPPELLYPADISALHLSAELVVLSACESGLGELVRGEGLLGMSRAFLYAGARALVVTLWPVDDRSTADFMRAFYAELQQGRSAPEALRLTKLAFLHSDRPARQQISRWAAFVLVGDPPIGPLGPDQGAQSPTKGSRSRPSLARP